MVEGASNGRAAAALPTKKRGTGFPVVALDEAVRLLKTVGKHGSEHSQQAFAAYLGHTTTNSGSFKRRSAAFRDWKLITYSADRVLLTELGQRIAFPPDPAQEASDLRDAFANCQLFQRIYDESAKDTPYSLENLGNRAVLNYKVGTASKDIFAQSLSKSAVAAGLAKMVDGTLVFVSATPDAKDENPSLQDGPGTQETGKKPPEREHDEEAHTAIPTLFKQAWPIDGGQMSFEIRSDHPLSPEVLVQMARVVTEA